MACNTLYMYLPLLTETFIDFALDAKLGQPGAIDVAEVVERVPDSNRLPKRRVDFFC